MSDEATDRGRELVKLHDFGQEACVADLSPRAATKPAAKLLVSGRLSPLGLLLEGAKPAQLALRLGDLNHPIGTDRSQQLVFQIPIASEETFHLQFCGRQSQRSRNDFLLWLVIEPTVCILDESGKVRDASGHDWRYSKTETLGDYLESSRITWSLDQHVPDFS